MHHRCSVSESVSFGHSPVSEKDYTFSSSNEELEVLNCNRDVLMSDHLQHGASHG